MKIRSRVGLLLILVSVAAILAVTPAVAGDATSCDTASQECHITITINIAFVGATDDYINNVHDEIEEEWNGAPFGTTRTYGDCKCPVEIVVNTKKVASCDSTPSDYHCIEVTNYSTKPPYSANETVIGMVKNGTVDPRTSNLVTRHRGYMKGISTGEPVTGWWSDIMSTPTASGERCIDFAHEAGHLMGLDDGDGGVMDASGARGPNAGVTQQNINDAVDRICGSNACPDRCCCGNAKVDGDKGEACDPLASPTGCTKGEACCPVCCNCYAPCCDPKDGEYPTKEDCEKACGEEGSTCYFNYYTGCWDCTITGSDYLDEYQNTTESIWKANESRFHATQEEKEAKLKMINGVLEKIGAVPIISGLFADERINFYLDGEEYHAITAEGELVEADAGAIEDPTVEVFSDTETVELILDGELGLEEALEDGRIRVEGVGFANSVKFGFVNVVYNIFSFFSDLF